jgi:hypothetical protein
VAEFKGYAAANLPKEHMTKQSNLPVVLILASLWTFWGFGYNTVFQRLMIDVDGK